MTRVMTTARLRFAGYAALFGVRDLAGDLIRPGAFAASLASRAMPDLLLSHQRGDWIGKVEYVAEDPRGLRVIGAIDDRIGQILPQGLSFGYRASDARPDALGRELFAIDLYEISLTGQPLQPNARTSLWWRGGDKLRPDAIDVWG